jgi:hypothetical protein
MNPHFAEVTEGLDSSFRRLLAMEPFTPVSLPKRMPKEGIYLFSENQEHFYVGRSKDIRGRIARHSRPSATHRIAACVAHCSDIILSVRLRRITYCMFPRCGLQQHYAIPA